MTDKVVLVRVLTALDIEFEQALQYHDNVHDGNND